MSEIVPIHQLVVGLPGSGKTTFLAALWHALESAEVSLALQLTEVHGMCKRRSKNRPYDVARAA